MLFCIIEDEEEILFNLKELISKVFVDSEFMLFSDIPTKEDLIDNKKNIDIIITDCDLPSGNICESDFYDDIDIPILILTGLVSKKIEKRKYKNKNIIILQKPINLKLLVSSINKLKKGDVL